MFGQRACRRTLSRRSETCSYVSRCVVWYIHVIEIRRFRKVRHKARHRALPTTTEIGFPWPVSNRGQLRRYRLVGTSTEPEPQHGARRQVPLPRTSEGVVIKD